MVDWRTQDSLEKLVLESSSYKLFVRWDSFLKEKRIIRIKLEEFHKCPSLTQAMRELSPQSFFDNVPCG